MSNKRFFQFVIRRHWGWEEMGGVHATSVRDAWDKVCQQWPELGLKVKNPRAGLTTGELWSENNIKYTTTIEVRAI